MARPLRIELPGGLFHVMSRGNERRAVFRDDAFGGLLVGSERFAKRVRRLLADRPADPDVPQVQRLRGRPSLQQIVAARGR